MDVFITPIQFGAASGDAVIYSFWNAGSFVAYNVLFLDMSHTATEASRKADIIASYTAYAATNSYSISRVLGLDLLGSSPTAHIADAADNAPTNLATNYNLVSGVLGLANGLNDANTKQNDLAAKYNDLADKFNLVLNALEDHAILLP